MLLRFGLENFRSFRDYTELSFIASRRTDEPRHRITVPGTQHRALPAIGLFGANASGKSNLLDALAVMRTEVVDAMRWRGPTDEMDHRPFALDGDSTSRVTTLDCDFALDGVRYHYGFRYDAHAVREEWLYAFPKSYRQVWYHRRHGEESYYNPSKLRGPNKAVDELTRPNCLFLSSAAQHNHEQLTPIYRWFKDGLDEFQSQRDAESTSLRADALLFAPRNRALVRSLLAQSDLGVFDFRMKESDGLTIAKTTLDELPSHVRDELIGRLGQPAREIELAHRGADGRPIYLPFHAESHGTRLLLLYGESVLSALRHDRLLFIDELDAGLHPRLSAALLGLFTDENSNPTGAQLLFTTHDESLLGALRRDSIYFVDKDPRGMSSLVSLAEYKTRQRDDIRRGYSEGRFGGVPIIGDLTAAVADSRAD